MRPLAAVFFFLAALVALVLWLGRGETAAPTEGTLPDSVETPPPQRDTTDESLTAVAERERAHVDQLAAAELAACAGVDRPRSRVFGRVVDELGAPLAGVIVALRSHTGPWSDVVSLPLIEVDGRMSEGLRATTGADGKFLFEVSLPTAERVGIDVEPSLYRLLASRTFGRLQDGHRLPLTSGDNDQRDFVLGVAGAVTGRVLADDGTPLAQATAVARDLDLGKGADTGIPRTTSDATGTYVLGHLPEGSWNIALGCAGWLTQEDVRVEVRRGKTMPVSDVRLARSPKISGIVVDESGAPVPQVIVVGRPAKTGSSVSGTTREDGTFTLFLARNAPHSLDIPAVFGFEPWGKDLARDDPSRTFEPGRADVRIVLQHTRLTTFRIVDAITKQPIERFGMRLGIRRFQGAFTEDWSKEVDLEDHPGGEVTLSAKLGESVALVRAPGHAPVERDVVHDAGASAVQTIALDRESTLDGRLVFDRAFLGAASLVLERDVLEEIGKPAQDAETFVMQFEGRTRYDLGTFQGRDREVGSALDGSFSFGELAPGTWRLRVESRGARTTLRGLRVPAAGALHLGDVTIAREATVRGRIVTSPREPWVGFTVQLVGSSNPTAIARPPDGAFEFKGLEAGPHRIIWSRNADVARPVEGHSESLVLAAGEVRELVIDARPSEPCTVVVRVTRGGVPTPHVGVAVDMKGARFGRPRPMEPTDATGTATIGVEGGSRFQIVLLSAEGRTIGLGEPELEAVPGGRIERTIDVSTGSLVVELPASLVPPPTGVISISLQTAGKETQVVHAWTSGTEMDGQRGPVWNGPTIAAGELATGTFDVHVSFYRIDPTDTKMQPGDLTPMRPEHVCTVTIEAGREVRIVVP